MYTAKSLEKGKVGVYKQGNLIGHFERNRYSHSETTFAPFERDGQWYALYSPSYTALSVMKINEGADNCVEYLGGEDQKNGSGFCPVEVVIPRYQWWVSKAKPAEQLENFPVENREWLAKDRYTKEYDLSDGCFEENPPEPEIWEDMGMEPDRKIGYENFAFVLGCYWGGPYDIVLRDISEAHLGIIKDVEEFPDFEYFDGLSLKDSIKLSAFEQYDKEEETHVNFEMAVKKTVRFETKSKKITQF